MRDLLTEALAGVLQRPARSALTALGTVLGVGATVAVLGLTASASSRIDDRFNALTATEVTVADVSGETATEGVAPTAPAFPDDAQARVERLNGVTHAGVHWPVPLPDGTSVRPTPARTTPPGDEPRVVAASPGTLRAADVILAQGRLFDAWHAEQRQHVAVVGSGLAARLGITTLATQPALFIGDEAFTVVGVVDDAARKADLLLSVVVPHTTAERLWGVPGVPAEMLIATRLGAARQVATEAAVALDPTHPEHFRVTPPPDPSTLRGTVTDDLRDLFLILAAACLVIGVAGISNTTLVAVLERAGEIGLRRALGAQRRYVTGQFLAESAILGTLGGLVGTSIGALIVIGVALVRDWTPVLHPEVVALAPCTGLATGLLAGVYPAWRAGRVQPDEALRR
ncbi:ABC transporter permease [Streptomyces sp. 8K308]|uniref:ABC transporter permease n=1 Tax=Streptomyces sp. 8K308 TaxID=2530388 RepID=UPI0010472C38|nr:ABC transporter permease [Streptomyces sp. 8K308]TDC22658.1 ABC transporter permease [Streptomyces sp. 8K308]